MKNLIIIIVLFIKEIISVINTSDKNVNVDFDGTLASNKYDVVFNSYVKEYGFEMALVKWDTELKHDCKLNMIMLLKLVIYKLFGKRINLFTNRGMGQYDRTINNIGILVVLFNNMYFFDGKKGVCRLSGTLYDNEEKYSKCCVNTIIVESYVGGNK
jgi:hypothetical protein